MPPDFEQDKQEMSDEADSRGLLQHVCALQPCFIDLKQTGCHFLMAH